MKDADGFETGMDRLLRHERHRLRGARVALVSHQAATDARGATVAARMAEAPDFHLQCLLGPEHGYFGLAGPGEKVFCGRFGSTGVPLHSVYGETRQPTAAMLRQADCVVFDLQDLGVRCYTYLATLCNVMRACREFNLPLIVADRPIPLPNTLDGPAVASDALSFLAPAPVPFCTGMTPGESAQWLQKFGGMACDLTVVAMRGYRRQVGRYALAPGWVPPSPGIPCPASAMLYPATVFSEALPILDVGRGTPLSFQLLALPGFPGRELAQALTDRKLAGLAFYPHCYSAAQGLYAGQVMDGVRLVVLHPERFRPLDLMLNLLDLLSDRQGRTDLWDIRDARPAFLDTLMGSSEVRYSLMRGDAPSAIRSGWCASLRRFRRQRASILLYAAPDPEIDA